MGVRDLLRSWGRNEWTEASEDEWVNPTVFHARARDIIAVLFIAAAIGMLLYALSGLEVG